jgi:hypothetical protein
LGSRLALFALAVQIVVSFGHVHFYGVASAASKAGMSAASSATVDGSVAALRGTLVPLSKSNGSADSDCPICALIQLAATAAPSAPPALWLPANLRPAGLPLRAQVALAASPQFPFRARAPPSI